MNYLIEQFELFSLGRNESSIKKLEEHILEKSNNLKLVDLTIIRTYFDLLDFNEQGENGGLVNRLALIKINSAFDDILEDLKEIHVIDKVKCFEILVLNFAYKSIKSSRIFNDNKSVLKLNDIDKQYIKLKSELLSSYRDGNTALLFFIMFNIKEKSFDKVMQNGFAQIEKDIFKQLALPLCFGHPGVRTGKNEGSFELWDKRNEFKKKFMAQSYLKMTLLQKIIYYNFLFYK